MSLLFNGCECMHNLIHFHSVFWLPFYNALIDYVFRPSIKGSISDVAVIDLRSTNSIVDSHVFKLVSETDTFYLNLNQWKRYIICNLKIFVLI